MSELAAGCQITYRTNNLIKHTLSYFRRSQQRTPGIVGMSKAVRQMKDKICTMAVDKRETSHL